MVRFGQKEIVKKKFYAAKKPMRIWDVNVYKLTLSISLDN